MMDAVPPSQSKSPSADPAATGQFRASVDSAADLVRILDQYLADLQAGRTPDRQRLLADHPALAGMLDSCLAAMDFIHRAACPADAPAQLGDFRVVREIGRGGMGVVYEAEQVSLKRRVALKVLRFGGASDAEALQRFQREAETVARLHHTNIVPVFAVGCERGVYYYAMQFIDGQSLAAVGEQARVAKQPLDGKQAARWALQAAEALAYAHQRGVIHRDVKPSNLLLDAEGILWLTDFGLAKRADELALTATGALLGTPRYMSPEQAAALDQPVDHRSDLYSLGATLYELLTARPVFDADTPQKLLAQIRDVEPVPPRRLRPDLPRDLETICLKCLHKEPARRYATAQALVEDMRAFLEDRPIRARRPSWLERSRRWLGNRRFTTRSAAVITVLAMLATGLLIGWVAAIRGILRENQTGQLTVTVNSQAAPIDLPLTAELLDARRDELLTPRFTVPTTAPVSVPVGMHRLRLSRPGGLSATYWLNVRPNYSSPQNWEVVPSEGVPRLVPGIDNKMLASQWYHKLEFARSHLWAKPLEHVVLCEVVPGAKRQDVICMGNPAERPGVVGFVCRRHEGATGRVLWEKDVAPGDNSPLATAWRQVFQGGSGGAPTRLLRPAFDLDGDGVPDLVWPSSRAALLAMSGRTGDLLWSHALSTPAQGAAAPSTDATIGSPIVHDVDGDGIPDVIATFLVGPEGRRLLQAVSGRPDAKKRLLWSVELPKDEHTDMAQAGGLMPWTLYESRHAPSLAKVRGRTVIVCVVGDQLISVEARTGKPAWPPRRLGFRLARAPQFADLDGDGSTDALLLHEDTPNQLTLTVLDLARGTLLWEATWPGVPEPHLTDHPLAIKTDTPPDWPLVVDLDGDGHPEVIVRQAVFPPGRSPARSYRGDSTHSGAEGRLGLLALDGRSGEVRWCRSLGRWWTSTLSVCQAPFRLLVGLNRGGGRDLFVASLLSASTDPWSHPVDLYVDALSGCDGQPRWWWRQPLTRGKAIRFQGEGIGPLRWWPAGENGAPLLVVPVQGDSGDPAAVPIVTYVLAAESGHLQHTIPFLQHPQLADLDGDGRPELLGWNMETAQGVRGPVWQPIRGTAPATIAQAEIWKPSNVFSFNVSTGQSAEEWEPEPPADTGPPPVDPRKQVPPPWDRIEFFRVLGSEAFAEEAGFIPPLALLTVVILLGVPFVLWAKSLQRKYWNEAEFRRRSRRNRLEFLLLLGVSLFLTLAGGAVWLWYDSTLLEPEQTYRWGRWYVAAFFGWDLVFLLCAWLWLPYALPRWLRERRQARLASVKETAP